MIIRLGYVANPITFDHLFTYGKTISFTNFSKLEASLAYKKRNQIINSNLNTLKMVLKFNLENEIFFYRITHNLIPLATHKELDSSYFSLYKETFLSIGKFIKDHKMRIDAHPDEFCVLNSVKEEVVEQSIRTLLFHQNLFKALDIPGLIILHIGSATLGKEAGINKFKEVFKTLNPDLQKMIILENDDKIYTVSDTLKLCEELKIPMVLDYHHYLCNKNNEKIEKYLLRICKTWDNSPFNPKMHFSSSKSKKEKRAHSTYLNFKDFLKFIAKIKDLPYDIDIMLECKGKEEGLFRLARQLSFFSTFKKINNSTFLIEKKQRLN